MLKNSNKDTSVNFFINFTFSVFSYIVFVVDFEHAIVC